MSRTWQRLTATLVLPVLAAVVCAPAWTDDGDGLPSTTRDARNMLDAGRHTFRFDTFGDEGFWGGTIRLHEAIEGGRFGGVGPGVSPRAALAVGL